MDQTTYNTLDASVRSAQNVYDWEVEQNDNKRNINTINPDFIQDIDYEVKQLFYHNVKHHDKTNVDSKVKRPDYPLLLMEIFVFLTCHFILLIIQMKYCLIHLLSFNKWRFLKTLFSNVLKGTLTILDSQGLAELLPFIGDETLIMTFSTPSGEGNIEPIEKLESRTQPRNLSSTI